MSELQNTQRRRRGCRLNRRGACRGSRKNSLESDLDAFPLCFLAALFLAAYRRESSSVFTSLFPRRWWTPWGQGVSLILSTTLFSMWCLSCRMCPISKRGRRKEGRKVINIPRCPRSPLKITGLGNLVLSNITGKQIKAFLSVFLFLYTTRKMWKMTEKSFFKKWIKLTGKIASGTDKICKWTFQH